MSTPAVVNPNITDDDLKSSIRAYKQIEKELEALKIKVADEQKKITALADQQKVKKLLKDIISQPG